PAGRRADRCRPAPRRSGRRVRPGLQPSVERFQDAIDGLAVRAGIAHDLYRRLRIGGFALDLEPGDDLGGIAVAQQRTGVLARHAFDQGRDVAVEPDRDTLAVDQLAGVRLHEGAAAGRDDARSAVEQPCNHAPLAVAEVRFAEALEDFRDGHLRGLLDLLVGVSEGQAEQLGALAADCRLAHAHHSDEHDRPVYACGAGPDLAVAEAAGFDGHCRTRYRWANRACKFGRQGCFESPFVGYAPQEPLGGIAVSAGSVSLRRMVRR